MSAKIVFIYKYINALTLFSKIIRSNRETAYEKLKQELKFCFSL